MDGSPFGKCDIDVFLGTHLVRASKEGHAIHTLSWVNIKGSNFSTHVLLLRLARQMRRWQGRTGVEHVVLDVPGEGGEQHANIDPGHHDSGYVLLHMPQQIAIFPCSHACRKLLSSYGLQIVIWMSLQLCSDNARVLHSGYDCQASI